MYFITSEEEFEDKTTAVFYQSPIDNKMVIVTTDQGVMTFTNTHSEPFAIRHILSSIESYQFLLNDTVFFEEAKKKNIAISQSDLQKALIKQAPEPPICSNCTHNLAICAIAQIDYCFRCLQSHHPNETLHSVHMLISKYYQEY